VGRGRRLLFRGCKLTLVLSMRRVKANRCRGGLGHFAVLWAVALGAEVTVLSHSADKKDDALKMGAKHFICTKDKDWHKPHQFEFNILLNTSPYIMHFDLSQYFSIIKVNGHLHNVGMPEDSIQLRMQQFASNGCYLGTSHIGNRPEMEAMLKLASKQNIKSWVETIKISEAGCKEAVERVKNNDRVRYRFTLVGFDEAFGKRT
jgi:alcohol dehydrogenase (NADP+)